MNLPDVVSPTIRSKMMSGIRSKNTRPEMLVRRGLHRLGFRFKLHEKILPGKPDLVFPKHRAVIFVHGCFWHGHDCPSFKWPKTREAFWRAKIMRNRAVDTKAIETLLQENWRCCILWECALKGRKNHATEELLDRCRHWLLSDEKILTLRGSR